MIYRVVLDDTIDLHTSDINCMLLNPSLDLEMNSAGSFNFTLPPSHPYWDAIKVLKSTIDVYEDGDLIFTGRIASIEKNWNNERVVQCEGALAYFNDSIHRQMKWETPLPIASEDPTVHNFLKDILDNHNVFEGAENANRHIFIGNITVDPEVVTREVNYDTTLDILTRMCIDTNGGYMSVRKDLDDGKLYLDWIKDFTEESGQPAQFGLNLLNFDTSLAAEDICTGVLARGAEVNEQTVMLNDVELVDETTYPDMSVTHYTTQYQDILWHREGVEKFGQVVQVHDFSDAQTAWKDGQGQIVANSLFEMAKKWLEEKNTKIETIEVEVAELAWLGEGMPKYKLGQIVELSDEVHMAGESYETRLLPMYKLSCDLNSGSKKVTLGTPPKKELTQISASNSDSSTLSSSGSSSGSGGSGEGEECRVHDVKVNGTSVVTDKIANVQVPTDTVTTSQMTQAISTAVAPKANTADVNQALAQKQDNLVFNSQDAATAHLTKIKNGNDVYDIPPGTEVEANPTGTATSDLTKLKVGNDIYGIPSGGTYTAGDYISINNDEISVNRNLIPNAITYKIVTKSTGNNDAAVTIQKYENNELISSTDYVYTYCTGAGVDIDNTFNLSYNRFVSFNWSYLLLVDSENHSAGYRQDWNYQTSVDYSEVFETEDLSGYQLVIKSELEAQVEANPSEAATDDLNTIKIGNTVYDIPGGGSSTNYGKFKCDELFVNDPLPSPTSGTSDVIKTYTLNHSIDDYDAVVVEAYGIYFLNDSSHPRQKVTVLVMKNDYYENTQSTEAFRSASPHHNQLRVLDFNFSNSTTINTNAHRTESGNEPILYKVYGLKFENKLINRSDIYSEEERMIGRWIDGKPIYQKSIYLENLTIPQNSKIKINISDYFNNVENAIFIKATDSLHRILPYINVDTTSNYNIGITVETDTDSIYLSRGNSSNTTRSVYITLQYTKTTDAPNSGFLPEDPQMVMMSDYYSEEDQVVGRWTDGKPLYQKTYRNVSITNRSDNVVDSSIGTNKVLCNHKIEYTGLGGNYRIDGDPSFTDTLYINSNGQLIYYVYKTETWSHIYDSMDLTIQYTKTTDAPGTGPTKGNLIYLPALYSEEEREVGVWTDGKPLYQKTYKNLGINVPQATWISTGISINNIDHWSVIYNKSLTGYDNEYPMFYRIYNGSFDVFCQYAMPLDELTLQYTKTTDQPGSGTWTPEGQLAHHYSTSEKIVGTWIDGSTVYERTWDFGISGEIEISPDTWTSTIIPRSNINLIVDLTVRSNSGCAWGFVTANCDTGNYIQLYHTRLNNKTIKVRYVTLQYTKSS